MQSEHQSQASGRALVYKIGAPGDGVHGELRIGFATPATRQPTYLAKLNLGFDNVTVDRRDMPVALGRFCRTLDDLKAIHAGVCKAILRGDSVLIPVKAGGKGPTPASQKVKVSLRFDDPAGAIEHVSTITVPVSQLVTVEGQLYAPRWLVRKTLNDRTRAIVSNANLPAGQWFGAQQLWDSVFAPAWQRFVTLQEERARQAEISRQQIEARDLERAQRRAAAREAAAIEQAAQPVAKPAVKRVAKTAANKPATEQEVIENAVVVWTERRASSTKNEQWLESAEGCSVRFSGQRAYVTKPNGSTIIKTRNTIQINGEAMPSDHAVRKYLDWQAQNPAEGR